MNDKNSLLTSPQLDNYEQLALALTAKQVHSLYKKSKSSGIALDVLEQVYLRGYNEATELKEQAGFARVDSFVHGGLASSIDQDLDEGRKALARQASRDILHRAAPEIAHTRKKLKKLKNNKYMKALRENAVVINEPQSVDPNDPSSRFVGTDKLTQIYKSQTPGQGESRLDVIKRIVRDAQAKKEE